LALFRGTKRLAGKASRWHALMRKKVVMYSEAIGFVMECGHTSPIFVSANVKVLRAIDRMNKGTLYRDCPICQRRANKACSGRVGAEAKNSKPSKPTRH